MDDNLDELMDEIYDMPEGTARIAVLEDAIRMADQLNRVEDAFELRIELIRDCTFFGQQLKALSAFSWCLGKVDADSERFSISDILWEYKWICSNSVDFHEISLEKCHSLLADYKARLESEGCGLYSYWYTRMNHGITLNDKAMAKEAFDVLHTLKRDSMADCTACVQDGLVYYKLFMGLYEEALETAKPILTKRMSCAEVPHMTYANLVMPALEAGDTEAAAGFAEVGYKLVSRNPEFVDPVASYIRYYSCTDINKAVKLYIKHLKWSLNPFSLPLARMRFSEAAAIIFSKLAKTKETVKMRLPEDFAAYDVSGSYNVSELAEYHKDIALELAGLFDKRNGNDGYTKTIL